MFLHDAHTTDVSSLICYVITRALSCCIPPYVQVVLVASQSSTVCRKMTDACQAMSGIHNDICYPSGIIWSQPVSAPFLWYGMGSHSERKWFKTLLETELAWLMSSACGPLFSNWLAAQVGRPRAQAACLKTPDAYLSLYNEAVR